MTTDTTRREPSLEDCHIYVRQILKRAVRRGQIVKPLTCQRCGLPVEKHRLHGHHADYSKPLEVEWLCGGCHREEHRRRSDRWRSH